MAVSTKTERRGYWLFKQSKVLKDLETDKRIHFIVHSREKDHFVIFDKKNKEFSCDCEYFSLHLKPCSHIVASQFLMKEKDKNK